MKNKTLIQLSLMLSSIALAQGALITYQSPVAIDNAGAFVDTNGSLVLAANVGTAGDNVTVGGVDFTGTDISASGLGGGVSGAGGVTLTTTGGNLGQGTEFLNGTSVPGISDSDLTNLLGSAAFGSLTLELSGLTDGDTYFIQIISHDSTTFSSASDQVALGNGIDGTTTGLNNVTDSTGNGPGNAIIGTFIADGVTQTLNVAATSSSDPDIALINGIQIRTIAVPEPTSISLLFGGGLLALLHRRRK